MCFALLFFSAAPVSAQPGEGVISEGAFDYKVTSTGAEVIKFYNSGNSRVEVPAQVQGYSVVAIGDEVFRNLGGITEIVLPDGIQTIGDRAFYACADLEEIALPISLVSIGEMAFCNCYALTSLMLPRNVQTIGISAFLNCTSMTDLQVVAENPYYKAVDNVLFSGDMTVLLAYLNAKTDTVYTIPEQVRYIEEKAFLECTDLQEVRFPSSLYEIEKYAFSGCTTLTQVVIPNGVEIIGTFAFSNCSSLTTVSLGNGVTAVPAYTFSNCSSLNEVTFSKNLQSIGSKAFAKCGTFAQICIPDSVQQIAADAFADTGVNQVRFYSTVKKEAFADRFTQSQTIICLCDGEHTYQQDDPVNCTVCDYMLDLSLPPVLSSVTADTVQLVVRQGFAYSYDLTNWRTDGYFTGLQPNHTYEFYARLAGDTQWDQVSDPLTVTTDRATQPKAPKPEVESKGATSVTLKTVSGCEYSLDGVHWQTSPQFTGLQMNVEYSFYQRYAQTQTHYAGPVSDALKCKVLGITEVTSQTYLVQSGVIRKIPVGTTVTTLLQGLQGGAYCKVYKGSVLQSGQAVACTGMTVKLEVEGSTMATYTLVVTGDTNGDGEISITDMIAVKAHVLDKNRLSGVYAQAADTSGDNSITITDFIQIKAKILGKGIITPR